MSRFAMDKYLELVSRYPKFLRHACKSVNGEQKLDLHLICLLNLGWRAKK